MAPVPRLRPPREVAGYVLGRRLGSGTFGEVYLGRRGKEEVAIKLEIPTVKRSQLLNEWGLYRSLAGCPGIPRVYWHGQVGVLNALVMELLGPSLDQLLKRCDQALSAKTVLMCAEQMTKLLQSVHSKGIVHRDIKPNNFLVGRGQNSSQLYLVDFGLSKYCIDQETEQHIPYKTGRKGLTGTARYTSIGNHLGIEPTRRDDFQGLCYVLLRMARGTLPWQGIKAPTKKERNERILLKKMRVSPEDLYKGLPKEMLEFHEVCQRLEYSEEPPYMELHDIVRKALARRHPQADLVFDWTCVTDSEESTSSREAGHVEHGEQTASRSRGQRSGTNLKRKAGDLRVALSSQVPGKKTSKLEPA